LRRSLCPEMEASDASRDHECKEVVVRVRATAAVVPRTWIRGLVRSKNDAVAVFCCAWLHLQVNFEQVDARPRPGSVSLLAAANHRWQGSEQSPAPPIAQLRRHWIQTTRFC
jgi:hypothetical protein